MRISIASIEACRFLLLLMNHVHFASDAMWRFWWNFRMVFTIFEYAPFVRLMQTISHTTAMLPKSTTLACFSSQSMRVCNCYENIPLRISQRCGSALRRIKTSSKMKCYTCIFCFGKQNSHDFSISFLTTIVKFDTEIGWNFIHHKAST